MSYSFNSTIFTVGLGDASDACRLYVRLPSLGNTDNTFDLEDDACVLPGSA